MSFDQSRLRSEVEDYKDSYPRSPGNQWRCQGSYGGEKCNALLGLTDDNHSILHMRKSGQFEGYVYTGGETVVSRICERCGHMNFLYSDDLSGRDRERIRREIMG